MTELILFFALTVMFVVGLATGYLLTAVEARKRSRRGGYVDVKDLEW